MHALLPYIRAKSLTKLNLKMQDFKRVWILNVRCVANGWPPLKTYFERSSVARAQ